MKLVLEYVWIGGKQELHSKTRIVETETEQLTIKDIPLWNYDGSSTNQAEINNSDVILSPVTLFRDPFRLNKNAFLVMCETKRNNGTVLENSHREWANNTFNKDLSQEPWFGIEQEYFFIDTKTNMPVGYKETTLEEIKNIRSRILEGENFSDLAIKFSEDPGSSKQGGELDWMGKGVLAPEFEKVMIELPIGEVSEVFETQFGYHFLEVLDVRNHDLTRELIEDQAYQILYGRKFDEELENTLRSMRAEAFVEIKDLD